MQVIDAWLSEVDALGSAVVNSCSKTFGLLSKRYAFEQIELTGEYHEEQECAHLYQQLPPSQRLLTSGKKSHI